MLKFGFLPLAFLIFSSIYAQNLIANSGFEDINVCSEFGAKCAPAAWFRLPPGRLSGTKNLPAPVEGKLFEMVVVEHVGHPITGRVFLYSRLLCPLERGAPYKLRFWVNPGRQKKFDLGVALTAMIPKIEHYILQENKPTILVTEKDVVETLEDGWLKVEVEYIATGEEEFFTIGNFDPKPFILKRKGQEGQVKYAIDQIEFTAVNYSPPCPDFDARLKALYDQIDRHFNLLDEFPAEKLDSIPVEISTPEEEIEEEFDDETSTFDTVAAPVIKFVIPDIGFDFGKFILNPTADPVLQTCLAQITTFHPSEVQIIGYTDDVGSDAFNLDLSAKRAMAVRNWFVEKHGLSPTVFVVRGQGESNPIAPNDTEAGRQANRRVEINFVK